MALSNRVNQRGGGEVEPQYTSEGLNASTYSATIISGGYYIKSGVCHIDVTFSISEPKNVSARTISGFPPASTAGTSPNYFIGQAFNGFQMSQNPNNSYAELLASQSRSVGTYRFTGSYNTNIQP